MSDAICGGLIKESLFFSDPGAYMMNTYMADDKFDYYHKLLKNNHHNLAAVYLKEHARSAI